MATNIEITAQLNKMLVEQNQLYLTQAKIMRGQLAVMQQMAEAMGNVDVSKNASAFMDLNAALDEVEGKLEDLSKSTQASDASVKKLIGTTDAAGRSLKKAATATEKLGQQLMEISPAALAIDGAMRGLEFSFNVLGGGVNILKSVADGVWGVAKALLAMPFEIWDSIMAKAGQPGDTAIAEELENIRRQFGDLRTGSALAVREIARELRGPMVGTGLNAARVFGTMAQRLEAVRKTATALGPMFNQLSGDIVKNGQAIMQFQKGMGTSDEAMKAFGRTAIVTGRSVGEVQREYANYAIQLGKSFNINAREITQDMNDLVGDMKHFGGMSAKALNETIVYSRRLGIEVKNLTGLMDAFDNFDQAADATARLNQQFGIQIDTMEIMKADNPAERAEQLRKAFEASGRSIETLDRRSKSYLASQIGLSEADAELLFAEKNRGRNLDDVRKKAEEAERKQLKQTEALQRLTGSIDRVVKAGQELVGIFDAFYKGFMRGFEQSADARAFIRELRVILRNAWQEGYKLGRTFTEIFPAIKAVMDGLIGFFNPTVWKKTIHTVVDAFRDFFKTVESDPQAGLKTLWDRLKKAFFDHFDALSGPGGQMIDGFKRYFKVILGTIAAAARMAIPEIAAFLADTLKTIANFIKDGGMTKAIADTESIGGQMAAFFGALYDAFKDAVPVIWEGVKELFSVLWSKLVDWVLDHKMMVLGALAAYFAPSVILSVLGAGMGLAGKAIAGRLIEGIGSAVGAPSAQTQLTRSITSLTETLRGAPTTPVPPVAPGTAPAVGGVQGLIAQLNLTDEGMVLRAIKAGFALGLFVTTALIPLVTGIIFAALAIKGFGIDAGSLILATGVFMATGLVVGGLALVAKVVGSSGSVFTQGLKGLLPLGAFVGGFTIVAGILGGLLYLLASSLTPAELKAGSIAMLAISATLLSMIPLAAASALIGAAMSGPWAIAIGAAALAGLASLAAFAAAAIESGKTIIDAARSIDLTTGIKEKVDLLLSILGGLSDLAKGIGPIISAVAVASLDPNDTKGFSKMLGTVNEFVNGIKESAINFVTEAKNIAGRIQPAEIQKLSAFKDVLVGLSEFMQSVGNVVKQSSEDSWLAGSAMDRFNTQFDNMLITIAGSTSAPGFGELVKRLITSVGTIPGSPEQIGALANLIGNILTSVGNFLKTVADLSKGILKNESGELTNLRKFMGNLLREVFNGAGGAGLINVVSSIIRTIAQESRGLSEDSIRAVSSLGNLIGPILTSVGNILSILGAFKNTDGNIDESILTSVGTLIQNVFAKLSDFIPSLVTGINNAFRGLNLAGFNGKIKALEAVVGVITSISSLMNSIYWTSRNAGAVAEKATADDVLRGFRTIVLLFKRGEDTGGGIFGLITYVLQEMTGPTMNGLLKKARNLPNLSNVVSAISSISQIAASIGEISKGVGRTVKGEAGPSYFTREDINAMIHPIGFMIEVLTVDGFGNSGKTLSQLITAFNETGLTSRSLQRVTAFSRGLGTFANALTNGLKNINVDTADRIRDIAGALAETINDLSNVSEVNANTTLDRLSRNLGLGRSQSYTINNRNFSIVLNLDVKMDAGNFEQVLFKRSEMTAITAGRPLKSSGFRTQNETGGFNLE